MDRFPQRFGKYILLDRIASGGMAEVFRAKVTGAEDFHRLIAIKCILPHLVEDEEFCRMFIDEAKLASNLSHANISQIYELGDHAGRLYIGMELISGFNLREITRRIQKLGLRMPDSLVAYIISKAAEALDYAHQMKSLDGAPINIVHRDVSPQNILVSFDGAVKLVDFGIAKAEQRLTETQSGVLKGKFSYMAPEQVRGKPVDNRSDIFALGCVLWELLVGKKAFQGETDLEILEKVRNPRLKPVHQVDSMVSEVFTPILQKALASNPDKRYQRAHEFAEALQPLMIDQKVIVGSRVASEFMNHLFSDEISRLQELYQNYGSLGPEDCDIAEAVAKEHTKVFASFFEEANEGALRAPFKPDSSGKYSDLPSLSSAVGSKKVVVRQGTGSSQVKIEPTDSGSISLSDLKPVDGGPRGLLGALIAAIVILTACMLTIHYLPTRGALSDENGSEASESGLGTNLQEIGYLEIHALGADKVKVFVNNKFAGLAPVQKYDVAVGPVTIKLVAQSETGKTRENEIEILVTNRNTEDSPLKINIPFK